MATRDRDRGRGGGDRRCFVEDGQLGVAARRRAHLRGQARGGLQHLVGQCAARQVTHGCDDRHRRLDGCAHLFGALRGLRQGQRARGHGDAHRLGCARDLAHRRRSGFGTLRGVLLQQVQDHVGQWLGNEVGERRNGIVDVREGDVDLCFAGERTSTGRGLVGDDAQGIQVADGGRDLAHGLLGRQVLGGAHDHARSGQVDLARRARDAEVRQLHHAIRANNNVRGLDVAVHDARARGSAQRHRDLNEDRHEVLGRDAGAAAQVIRQRVAVDELHDDPADAVFLARILGVGDIRVRDRHRVTGLEAQAGQRQLLAR